MQLKTRAGIIKLHECTLVDVSQNRLPYFGLIGERVNISEKEGPVQIIKIGKKNHQNVNSSNIYLLKLFSNLEMAFEG